MFLKIKKKCNLVIDNFGDNEREIGNVTSNIIFSITKNSANVDLLYYTLQFSTSSNSTFENITTTNSDGTVTNAAGSITNSSNYTFLHKPKNILSVTSCATAAFA